MLLLSDKIIFRCGTYLIQFILISYLFQLSSLKYVSKQKFKGALNPNFLNLTINREKKICSRYVLVPFFHLLLLKVEEDFAFNIHSKVLLGMLSHHSVLKIKFYS